MPSFEQNGRPVAQDYFSLKHKNIYTRVAKKTVHAYRPFILMVFSTRRFNND
jgi:hypothetical protein